MAGSKNILIIEDERFISEMYARMLEKAGYKVDFAYSGQEGIKVATKKHYDLILLDIMMPITDGMEVLQNLRGEGGRGLPDTKIVILTNLAQPKSSKDALQAKADGYLIKTDVIPSKLVEIVDGLI